MAVDKTTIQCEVLLFAGLADAIGRDRLGATLPAGATVRDAVDTLAAEHPPIAAARPTLAVAVNEAYRGPDHALADGDVVALIPPVSGG